MGKGIGRLQGLGPMEEQTEGYDNLFGLSDNAYKVLTLCLLEVRFHTQRLPVGLSCPGLTETFD